ncbi:MAG: DinB family protein [Bacteroidetes bacterium]|nr:DinB family protein [Bacteroidota bacterium]
MIDIQYFSDQLKSNAKSITNLVDGLSNEQTRWRPAKDKWSILEVVNHLYEEEQKDFPLRLKYMLYNPEKTWPSINPVAWVIENNYNDRNINESMKKILDERDKSVEWLHEIKNPNWENEYEASWGKIKAGDMFAVWVTHDLLHIRQIINLKRLFYQNQFENYTPDYAGKW